VVFGRKVATRKGVMEAVGWGVDSEKRQTYTTETTRIDTRTTRFTSLADACHPLNPNAVSKLDS
jgi:hypothetical protein